MIEHKRVKASQIRPGNLIARSGRWAEVTDVHEKDGLISITYDVGKDEMTIKHAPTATVGVGIKRT